MSNQHTIATRVAPKSLVGDDGVPEYGYFDGVIESLGVEQFQYFNEMDKPASVAAKYCHFKQFQFVSIVTGRYLIGIAIADIRYVGSGFLYVFDIKANHLVEHTWLKLPALGYGMASSPFNGTAYIRSLAKSAAIIIENGRWQVDLNTATVKASLKLTPSALSLPISLCTPTAYNGWTYTQKHNGLAVTGDLTVNHEPQPLNDALGGYDFSAGFMRRETSWRWASINGRSGQDTIGLNLAAGVNETGANENVFWVDGQRHLLPAVQFNFNRRQAMPRWSITSLNDQVSLHFEPANLRSEKRNLWLLKSNFRQYMGYFDGHIIDNQGRKHVISRQLGLTEDHYAKW